MSGPPLDYDIVAQRLGLECDKLSGEPGAGVMQATLIQASSTFALAAAINRLAAAIKEKPP